MKKALFQYTNSHSNEFTIYLIYKSDTVGAQDIQNNEGTTTVIISNISFLFYFFYLKRLIALHQKKNY